MKSKSVYLLNTLVILSLTINANLSLAATVFFDDFSDGNLRDGVPATWSGGRVEDGDLILTGAGYVSAGSDVSLVDTSIRTQLTLREGCCVGVAARYTPDEGITNYYAGSSWPWGLAVDVGLGGDLDADVGPGGTVVSRLGSPSTDMDPRTEDIVIQLDVIGNEINVWVWRPNEAMPDEPILSALDDNLEMGPLFLWAASEDFDGERVRNAAGVFRYVHVADAHIPDRKGDLNQNGLLDAEDLDLLAEAIRKHSTDAWFDLNTDDVVDVTDHGYWVTGLKQTFFGDANLDGEFNSGDLIEALAAGMYELDVDASWSTGDFDGSGKFDSADLVRALADGGYEQGPRASMSAVPEPCRARLLAMGILGLMLRKRMTSVSASINRLRGHAREAVTQHVFPQ